MNGDGSTEWIQISFQEYEQIASLCNTQSTLGNAALSLPSSPPPTSTGSKIEFTGGSSKNSCFDVKTLTTKMQRQNLHSKISEYSQGIDAVRKTHAMLKAKLLEMFPSSNSNNDSVEKNVDTQCHPPRRRPPLMQEAFNRHIELSERVIRTVMQSSNHNHGPCGVLFENGMVRTSSAGDHEVNVVALAALRASCSRLKADFGGV